MSRYVRHDRNHPFVIKLGEVPGFANLTNDDKLKNFELHICACGLSKHKPFCDGSHKAVQNEKPGVHYTNDKSFFFLLFLFPRLCNAAQKSYF